MGSSDTLPRGLLDLAEVSCSSALVLWTLVLEVLFPAEEQLRISHRHPLLMLLVIWRQQQAAELSSCTGSSPAASGSWEQLLGSQSLGGEGTFDDSQFARRQWRRKMKSTGISNP